MIGLLWVGFLALVLVGISLDLGLLRRRPHEITPREALAWTGFWIGEALAFSGVVYLVYESQWQGWGVQVERSTTGVEAVWLFLGSYLMEKSLSLDNVVVMACIFSDFRVPRALQHHVLLLGVLGAVVFRFVMLVCGVALIEHFAFVTYVFGAILLLSAVRMLLPGSETLQSEDHFVRRILGRFLPIHDAYEGRRFVVRRGPKRYLTRLAIVLALVESSDLVFALDSIPAVLAITTDPFLVVTSNVFAILGLRSLFFAITPLMEKFRYLKAGLVALLGLVGVKLIISHHVEIPALVTLAAIVGIVLVCVAASVLVGWREHRVLPARGEPGGTGES